MHDKGRSHRNSGWPAAACLIVLLALGFSPAARPADPIVLAVHPYLSPAEIERRFAQLVKRLSTDLELPIELRVSADYDSHIRTVGEGRAEIAFIGPAELLLAEARHGPRILLGQVALSSRRGLSGHLVARQPSSVGLQALRGRRVAFVDASSTMGYLVPRAILEKAGLRERDFSSVRFVGSHDNVALGVLAGEFDVGAVKDEIFEKYRSRGLVSLHEMPTVPEHVFVASPRLPLEWQIRLRRALHRLHEDAAGRQALTAIRSDLSSVAAVHPEDFQALRQLLGIGLPARKVSAP